VGEILKCVGGLPKWRVVEPWLSTTPPWAASNSPSAAV